MPIVSDVTDEQLNSQAEVLTSKDVLDEVIDPGWATLSPQQRPAGDLARHDASVEYLLKHITVTPTKKSHIIEVVLKARDPHLATDQMRRLLAAYMAKQQDLQRPAGAAKFFADAADKYKAKWEEAQARLSSFEQAKQLVSPHDQETSLQLQLADADTQLRNTDVQIAELAKRIDADTAAVHSIPQRLDTLERNTPDEAYLDQLRALLVQLTNQRTELLTKYKSDDRLVQQVNDQIASTQASLDAATKNSFADSSTNVNPTWAAADASLSEKKSELEAARGRRAGLVASIAQVQALLTSTEGNETAFTGLQQEASNDENNYQVYMQKRDAALVADAMDAHALLNVAVVEQPTYSPDAVFPKPILDSILAVFSALLLAGFAVFLAESGRKTFATPRELELGSGYPVLATIPMVPALEADQALPLPASARVSILTAVSAKTTRAASAGMLRLW